MEMWGMKRVWQKFKLGLMLLALFSLSGLARAEDVINVTGQSWDAEFRDHLTFTLEAESPAEIVEVNLFYQILGQVATSRNEADFSPGQAIQASFKIDQTKPENYFPPGTELTYWWKIVDAAGNELRTEKEQLLYLDDRYPWQRLENERLTLYWYEGGQGFGQTLFDRANEALDTLQTDMGISLENPIKVFIYANHSDLLGAISTSAQEWTGGQAFTTYGVVVIGVAPSQLDWGLNATTHEMTHLVVHQATENPFGDLPRWLDEGIAVYNENQEELVEDFRPVFDLAVQKNELMTLRTLSSPFPSDPLLANQAYGQSGAVVMFIIDTYGAEAMARLMEIFAEGALYDEALQEALGVDTDGLDNAFRASLDLPPLPGTESQAAAPQPEAAPAGESETTRLADEEEAVAEAPAESAAAPVVEDVPVPAPAPAEAAESSPSPLGGLACLAGLLPLVIFGLGAALKKV